MHPRRLRCPSERALLLPTGMKCGRCGPGTAVSPGGWAGSGSRDKERLVLLRLLFLPSEREPLGLPSQPLPCRQPFHMPT